MTETASDSPAGLPRQVAELLLRDRVVIWLGLAAVTALSWLYVYCQMAPMEAMVDIAAPAAFTPWTVTDFVLNIAIWWAMMPGMMLPSAAPMILTFAAINRHKRRRGQPFVPTIVFTSGYLIAWGAFGLFATFADWALERAALISPTSGRLTPLSGAVVVIAAGLFQLTPLKSVCLRHCRSPFEFVLNHWRDGTAGALRMGLAHGLYCLGCCWFLMALLFAAGIMSLLWMATITIFIFIEKLFPAGQWIARIAGVAMLGLGLYLLSQA